MRVMAAAVMTAALAAAVMPAATAARADDAEVERLVRQHVQPMLIAAGGMAVAVHIEGRTLSFNYGLADVARKEPITSDVLFNLASVGKLSSRRCWRRRSSRVRSRSTIPSPNT